MTIHQPKAHGNKQDKTLLPNNDMSQKMIIETNLETRLDTIVEMR